MSDEIILPVCGSFTNPEFSFKKPVIYDKFGFFIWINNCELEGDVNNLINMICEKVYPNDKENVLIDLDEFFKIKDIFSIKDYIIRGILCIRLTDEGLVVSCDVLKDENGKESFLYILCSSNISIDESSKLIRECVKKLKVK